MRLLRRQSGDTLVEVVLSIALMSVVMVTSFNIATASFRLGMLARERTQAANIAQAEYDKLRVYRDTRMKTMAAGAALDASGGLITTCSAAAPGCKMVASGTSYAPLSCASTTCTGQGPGGLYEVRMALTTSADRTKGAITVTWDRPGSTERNTLELPVVLVDTRTNPGDILDCSVIGTPGCS